jgi:hypothetical protein
MHWKIDTSFTDYARIRLGLSHLSDDLDRGVFGPNGYLDRLEKSPALQQRYLALRTELATLVL